MILIIGGAYQGKRAFAQRAFGINEEDYILPETLGQGDLADKPAVRDLEKYILSRVQEGTLPSENPEELFDVLKDKVVIACDISQGLVPMDAVERLWREENGRCLTYLASRADRVYRVFCGIESRLK